MEDVAPARRRWAIAAAIVYAGLIFVASSIPGHSMPMPSLWTFDKVIHLGVFTGLGFLVANAWQRPLPALAAATLYGALDEFHQHFTPGRSVEFRDWLADAGGAILGALIWLALHRILTRRRQPHGADPQVP